MTVLEFVVIALGLARIVRMLLFDAGPMAILDRIRDLVGANDEHVTRGSLGHMFNCPYCLATWLGVITGIAYVAYPQATMAVMTVLALSFVASVAVRCTIEM